MGCTNHKGNILLNDIGNRTNKIILVLVRITVPTSS